VAEVENEKFEPLIALEVVGHHDVAVAARNREPGLVFDRPQGIGLRHRSERLQRLGDDAVDE
jgi:hypothetical protein